MDIKSLVKKTLYYGGYYKLNCSIKTSRDKRLLILMYHDLVSATGDSAPGKRSYSKLTGDEFDAHLGAIRECCRVVSVEEAVAEIRRGGGLKENSIALTFDDGYASVYDLAFPLLKRHGLTATVYLLTDWINGNMTLWWEELGDLIIGFEVGQDSIAEIERVCREMEIEPSKYSGYDEKSRMLLLQDLSFEFMKISDERRNELMSGLRCALDSGSFKREEARPITWEQASEMADAGIVFGAHTCSHINLSYAEMDQAADEIARSKKEIESRLGRQIKGFAYPYGYDVAGYARFIPLLDELGFDYACTSWWGNNSDGSNRFQLLRNNLPSLKSRSLLKRELYIDLAE